MFNKMRNSEFDIAIIGGGPAGSTAAIHLSRAGLKVGLFEKKTFPREVLCGEFLSAEVIESLKKLNLYNKFLLLNPNRINSFRFISEDSSDLETKFQFEAYSMKRSIFDNFLLKEAEKSGAKIFQPTEVKKIERKGSAYELKILDTEKSDRNISAEFVIAAYGKQNILDRKLSRNFVNVKSQLNGVKFHFDREYFQLFPDDEIQIYSSEGIYCGINAVNENEATLCFLEDRKHFTGSSREHLVKLMRRNEKFKRLFKEDFITIIPDLQIYGSGDVFFGKKELIKKGIFMLGDAAGVIAPLAGDGIGMALESAEILSRILTAGFQNSLSHEKISELYMSEWNNHFNVRLYSARFIQKSVLMNSLRKVGIGLVKLYPSLLPRLIQLTRG